MKHFISLKTEKIKIILKVASLEKRTWLGSSEIFFSVIMLPIVPETNFAISLDTTSFRAQTNCNLPSTVSYTLENLPSPVADKK